MSRVDIRRSRVLLLTAALLATPFASSEESGALTVCALQGTQDMFADIVERHADATLQVSASPAQMLENVAACNAIVGMPGGRIAADLIRLGENLQWIQTFSAGVEGFAPLLVDRDGGLSSERGQAARILLYLMERDYGVQLLRGG